MQTINNMLILEAGEATKPEYRAAAVSSLAAGQSVSLSSLGLSFVQTANGIRIVDTNKGVECTVAKTPDEVFNAVATYQTAERILAFLSI